MTKNLCSPGYSNEIIMLYHTAMTLEITAGFENEDEVFVGKPNELGEVAFASDGTVIHKTIVLSPVQVRC